MRRVVPCLFVICSLVLAETGCRGRHQRPYYSDPFSGPPQASARRSPVVTESLLSPPDSQAPEVTHAGGEYKPRAAERSEVNEFARDFRPPAEDDLDGASRPPNPAATPDHPQPRADMDHAPDYSWIQGRLEYSALSGGVWKVRYAPISTDDEHGGSVILESAPDTSHYRAGDTVYAEGRIISNDQRRTLHNPVYQVNRMRVVEE
jgi:hypothetical protein